MWTNTFSKAVFLESSSCDGYIRHIWALAWLTYTASRKDPDVIWNSKQKYSMASNGLCSVWWIHLPVQETWVQSLGLEDPLEEEMATHSSILAWAIIHGQRSLAGYSPWGRKESDTTERLNNTTTLSVAQSPLSLWFSCYKIQKLELTCRGEVGSFTLKIAKWFFSSFNNKAGFKSHRPLILLN